MADEKLLSKLSIGGKTYDIKDSTARTDIASISGLAFNGAESLSGQIANLKAHGADSALSGINYVQEQLNSLSGLALNGDTSLSGAIAALKTKEAEDVVSLSGSIATLEAKHDEDKAALSGSIATLSGSLKSAIEGLDAEKTASGTFVSVTVTEADGKITAVNVTENDIASASGLTAETTARTTADTNLAGSITGLKGELTLAISGMYVEDTAVAGEFVTSVTETNGKIHVDRAGVSADQVMVSTITGINATGPSVQSALESLASHVTDTEAAGKVTITPTRGGADDAFAKRYTIYQGDTSNSANLVGEIDIPKDMVVSGGQVFTATGAGDGYVVGDKVLEITIANNDGTKLYIPVKDLTDTYKGVSGSEIITNVNASNGIEASLVTGSITKDKLVTAVQTSLGKADTSIQHVNGKPSNNAGGDVVLYGTDISRTVTGGSKTIDASLTDIEGSVDAIDTRVSGLEQWKAGITATYSNETLTINGLVGSVDES